MKNIYLVIFFIILFSSCTSLITMSEVHQMNNKGIQSDSIIFLPKKYTRTSYVTTKGIELITIYFKIENYSDTNQVIDLDDLNLIDEENKKHRVEIVQYLDYNDDDKFLLKINAQSVINRKIHFMMKVENELKYLEFKDEIIAMD